MSVLTLTNWEPANDGSKGSEYCIIPGSWHVGGTQEARKGQHNSTWTSEALVAHFVDTFLNTLIFSHDGMDADVYKLLPNCRIAI